MPEDKSWPRQFLNREQIELLAQDAMVAFLGFFDLVEIVIEICLCGWANWELYIATSVPA